MSKCEACLQAASVRTPELPNAIKNAWTGVKHETEQWEERYRELSQRIDRAAGRYRKAKQEQSEIYRELTVKGADRDRLQSKLERVLLQVEKLNRSTEGNLREGNRRQNDREIIQDKCKDFRQDIAKAKQKLTRRCKELAEQRRYYEDLEVNYRRTADRLKQLQLKKAQLEVDLAAARQKLQYDTGRLRSRANRRQNHDQIFKDLGKDITEFETQCMLDEQRLLTMAIYKERLEDDILRQRRMTREAVMERDHVQTMLKEKKAGKVRVYYPQSYR